MNEKELKSRLKKEGFKKIYMWKDKPNEFYEAHSHPYLSKIIILDGNMNIKINDKEYDLEEGDAWEIKSGEVHEVKIGPNGCIYIVGERK